MGIGQSSGGFFKVLGTGLFSTAKFMFSKNTWFISLTLIFLLVLMYGSVVESIQTQSLEPLITQIGSLTLGIDKELITNTESIINYQAEEGWTKWFQVLFSYLTLLSTLWVYFVVFKIFYWLFSLHNDSEKFWNIVFSVIVVAFFQVAYGLFAYGQLAIPFQGIIHLLMNSPELLKPLTHIAKENNTYLVNETNLTENVAI